MTVKGEDTVWIVQDRGTASLMCSKRRSGHARMAAAREGDTS
ncbi:hypothetical protein [Amycolatopsis anabasis]|nr:hypothetical protein [Amycolatopsis anabasis]